MQKSAIRGFWTICKIANIYAGRMNFRAISRNRRNGFDSLHPLQSSKSMLYAKNEAFFASTAHKNAHKSPYVGDVRQCSKGAAITV
jgi:hypothetical protein